MYLLKKVAKNTRKKSKIKKNKKSIIYTKKIKKKLKKITKKTKKNLPVMLRAFTWRLVSVVSCFVRNME